jgi:putative SOS response-associated peptidase YedK
VGGNCRECLAGLAVCVRYTLTKTRLADVAEALEAEVPSSDEGLYKPRYNAAPTNVGWVVSYLTGRRILRAARWSYLIGARRRLVNIRSESTEFSRFREVFASNVSVRRVA